MTDAPIMPAEEVKGAERPKYIPLYYSYLEQLGLLTVEQVGALTLALLKFGRDGTQPDFPRDSNLYMAFSFIADNSRRAEMRGLEILEKRRAAGRKGGQATVSKAIRNEKGRFISQESKQIPSTSKQIQAVQPYNNNNNNNNNDNNNNNRRYARVGARDDYVDEDGYTFDVKETLAFCRDIIKSITPAQEQAILQAAQGLTQEAVDAALIIACDNDVRTPAYIVSTLETQHIYPERRPEEI